MGKSPAFYLPWLWDIRQIILNHLVEWVKQSCWNTISRVKREISRRIVFCKKKCLVWHIFSEQSARKQSVYWHFFRQVFQSSFQRIERKLDKFVSWKKGVLPMFPNTENTFMQSSKLVRQLHQTAFYVPCANFSSKQYFFVKFHQSSFWDIFWKKLRTFREVFLALIMFIASLTKMFSMSPEERLRKHFPKQWVFPFLNIERKEIRIFGGCFQQVSQTAVFLSRGTIWGTHFQREIYFQHFF